MENKQELIESLLERATEYGKVSYELVKLKALDKTSDFVSTVLPHFIAIFFTGLFILFLSLGLAFWLGEILGKTCYGFFAIAAIYGIAWFIMHFFMHKWFKKLFCNYLIKKLLN